MASNNDSNSKKDGKSFWDSVKEGAGKTVGIALAVGAISGGVGLVLTGNPFIAWELAKASAIKAGTGSFLS